MLCAVTLRVAGGDGLAHVCAHYGGILSFKGLGAKLPSTSVEWHVLTATERADRACCAAVLLMSTYALFHGFLISVSKLIADVIELLFSLVLTSLLTCM